MSNKLTNCKTCSIKIAKSAKVCPGCGAKIKKPVYRNWFLRLVAITIMVIAIQGAINSRDNIDTNVSKSSSTTAINQSSNDLSLLTSMSKQKIIEKIGKPTTVISDDASDYSYMYENYGMMLLGNNNGATTITLNTKVALKKSSVPYSMYEVKIGDSFKNTLKKWDKVKISSNPDGDRIATSTTKEGYSFAFVASKDSDAITGFTLSTDGDLSETID